LRLGLEWRQLVARTFEVRAVYADAAKVVVVLLLGTIHPAALDHWVLIELDYIGVLLGGARTDVALLRAVDVLVALDGGCRVHVIVDETLALEEVLATLFLLLALHSLSQLLHQPQDLRINVIQEE